MCDRRWRERDAPDERTPVEKQIELTDCQRDRIVAVAPERRKPAALEPLRVHTQPGAIPLQRLGADPIPADEDEDITAERIALQALRHEGAEPIKPFAHIRGPRVRIDRNAPSMPPHRHSASSRVAAST